MMCPCSDSGDMTECSWSYQMKSTLSVPYCMCSA
eukprot:COSAG04_NODE_11215_length_722_cov_1.768860_2_plen_33_part_01